ncbi:hypothetical protein Tco_0158549 [Tanacetum coccineum]
MVPRAILMKSGLVSINTARQNISKIAISVNTTRQVNIAHSKTTVNAARPMSYLSKTTHLTVKRPIHKNTTFKNSNIDQRINIVRGKNFNTARPKAVVNAVKGNNFNAVKASACWDQRVIDSGRSRHVTWNMSYLIDYEEIDGGYVAFGGNPKGGKITGKVTIKTGNLDFENDKGKGILIEPVKPMNKKDLIRLDEETALKLQAEFDEEERLAREKAEKEKEANIALIEEWDDIQTGKD